MIHGFYFRFLRMTHSEWWSSILANLAYCVFFFKYVLKKKTYTPRIVSMKKAEALNIIESVHPDPAGRPEIDNSEANSELDLSIIVPIYNYADLIEKNICSILNQKTKYFFQLILVDDGSTDGAQEIVHKYESDPRVCAIFQKNQGIAGARNTGLNAATGKYIMFVDCDDTVDDDLVETLMSKAYQDDCDIVMCAHNLVKERNGQIYEVVPNIYPQFDMLGYSKNAKILNYAGLPWGKVYKRELWEKVRYFPGYWYEDSIIHSLLFTQCKRFAYVPKVGYQYRWYEKNFSHTQGNDANPKCIDMYWILNPILEKHKELGLPKDDRFEIMLLKHLSLYYYSKIAGLDESVVDALFVLACDLYCRYGVKEPCKLPYMLRVTKKALQQGDINLWKLATKYQK